MRSWARARRACFERDSYRCALCGLAARLEAHHVKALEDGGAAFELTNLRAVCRGCHIALHMAERDSRLPDFVKRWRELVRRMAV